MKTATTYLFRLATALLVMILFWSCTSVPGIKDETMTPVIRVPFLRVLLQENKSEISVDADGSFAIECLVGDQQTVFYSAQPVTIRLYGTTLAVDERDGELIQKGMTEINLIPRGHDTRMRVENRRYRGIIKVLPYANSLQLINVIYMEDYLRGVVPPEIGPRDENELEAIKAQAVAARTYAIGHLQQYVGEAYDMKSTVVDQVYEGVESENHLVNSAIDQTVGHVVMFQGDFINAYYHSTCGGMTDDIAQVWDKPAQPYLKPIDDSSACSWSKYYNWQESFSEVQMRGRLEQYLSGDRGRDIRLAPITDMVVAERTPGGRVAKLIVRTETDVYRFSKDRIRWVVGRTSNPDLILPSDRFDIVIVRDRNDHVEAITVKGHGYGHGVGMCQCGAIGLSRTGWKFDQIIKRYYTGVDIKKLY